MEVKQMKAGDRCICGSDKTWKACCGALVEQGQEVKYGFLSLTGEKSVRFFLGNVITDEVLSDSEGHIVVFTSRAQAIALNAQVLNHKYQVIGMSQAKWEQFQIEFPDLVVIPSAVA